MELLFLAHRAPFPPDRGDKIRSYHILRHLSARARVHLVAFAESEADREPPAELRDALASWTLIPRNKPDIIAAAEALAKRIPVSLAAFACPVLKAAVGKVIGERSIEAVYCFSGQMAQYVEPKAPPAIMDFVDVDSAKFAGYAKQGLPGIRWMMRREARLLGRFERSVAARVRASLFVTEAEARLFRSGGGAGRLLAVENGIDAGHLDPARVTPVAERGPLIVFTGQMDYRPNIEAAEWFVRTALPAIQAEHHRARFAIVGRAPTSAVRALAASDVIVTGEVDDVRPWLAAASVCVAPLTIARGIQNKVLEAMAMARPVVASSAAAEGIDYGGTIRVADGPAVARAVIELLDDPRSARTMGDGARAQVLERYDWQARLEPLDRLIAEIV